MRLIDADAIIQAVCTKLGIKDKKFLLQSEKAIVDVILNAPTIEVPTWIPFEIRPTDDEEREFFKSDIILVGKLPDEGDEILVSRGEWVWQDTFVRDELGAWLDSYGEIEDGMAWMPLPEPWKGADDE